MSSLSLSLSLSRKLAARGLTGLACVAASMCVFAQWAEGIYIPGPGQPMPNYWSGSNCRASGWAQVGEPIFAAQLLLNGELVNQWVLSDPEEEPPMAFFLKAMFDSSYFPNGTAVNVTFRVFTWPSGWWEGNSDPDPVVKNRLMMFEHGDPAFAPDAVPVVQGRMSATNYYLVPVNGGTWTDENYFTAMDGSNVAFYAGHGNDFDHQASDGPPTTMSWSDYESRRTTHIGTGTPPFNSGAPPINFLHLVACNCGDTDSFVRACLPYLMAWGGPTMENQAVMAYDVYIRTIDVSTHADAIWSKLAQGYTAQYTRIWFDSVWLNDNPGSLRVWDVYPGKSRDMAPGDLVLFHDFGGVGDNGAMRLRSVYTGTNVLPVGWYRPL